MPNLHKIALMNVQGIPGGLGQSDLSGLSRSLSIWYSSACTVRSPAMISTCDRGASPFGTADMAIGTHQDDGLMLGMQSHAQCLPAGVWGVMRALTGRTPGFAWAPMRAN